MIMNTFGWAVERMQTGALASRAGWNGKGMFLFLVKSWAFDDGGVHSAVAPGGKPPKLLPFIAMRTAQGDIVPWLASQTDMLASDWSVV